MITIVRSDEGDWIGVYRDGKLLEQGHSIQEEDLLRLLGVEFETTPEWDGSKHGQLPHDLAEVPFS